MSLYVCVCLFVPLAETQNLGNWILLVKERIANFSKLINLFFFGGVEGGALAAVAVTGLLPEH